MSLRVGPHIREDRRVKPPPISLKCDCGADGKVAYGERWTCERCGREYDTSRIPAEDYKAILAIRRRYQAVGWVLAVIVAAFVLFLVLANQPLQIMAGLPFILVTWFLYARPLLRRRFLKAIADRPQWELHAERAPEGPAQ
jgi:uncharacterized protein (DUF983 family)